MDFIPFFRFIASIIMFGISFYFLNLMLGAINSGIPTVGVWFAALMFLWTLLPAVVLFASGVRLIMTMQKRTSR